MQRSHIFYIYLACLVENVQKVKNFALPPGLRSKLTSFWFKNVKNIKMFPANARFDPQISENSWFLY